MTPKQIALRSVVSLVLLAVTCGIVLGALLSLFTPAQVGIAVCVTLFAYVVKMVYDMEVDKAERLQRLNKTR